MTGGISFLIMDFFLYRYDGGSTSDQTERRKDGYIWNWGTRALLCHTFLSCGNCCPQSQSCCRVWLSPLLQPSLDVCSYQAGAPVPRSYQLRAGPCGRFDQLCSQHHPGAAGHSCQSLLTRWHCFSQTIKQHPRSYISLITVISDLSHWSMSSPRCLKDQQKVKSVKRFLCH